MTEAEWLVCNDPEKMLEYVKSSASERKLRLFAVACCRSIWHLLTDDRSRKAVELAEQAADHPISPEALDAVSGEAEEAFEDAITNIDDPDIEAAVCSAASYTSNPSLRVCDVLEVMQATAEAVFDAATERIAQVKTFHDIFGNPFRPVFMNRLWLTWNDGMVVNIAKAIYDERAFDRLPILADALEDAGCDNSDILNHCRQPGIHVRGCWVVDLILGKE